MTITAVDGRPSGTPLTVPSLLFGPLQVRPEACITFRDGLLGFAGERRFILLPSAAEGIFWLQSVEDGTLAFLLVDPFLVAPDFTLELPGDEPASDLAALAIVTLSRSPEEPCTANLQAPLVLDLAARTGRQVILADAPHGTRWPVDLRAQLAGTR